MKDRQTEGKGLTQSSDLSTPNLVHISRHSIHMFVFLNNLFVTVQKFFLEQQKLEPYCTTLSLSFHHLLYLQPQHTLCAHTHTGWTRHTCPTSAGSLLRETLSAPHCSRSCDLNRVCYRTKPAQYDVVSADERFTQTGS